MRPWHSRTGLAIGMGLLLAGSGCGQPTAAETKPNGRSPTESVVRVSAAKPGRNSLKLETSQPGRIEAFEETPLYPKLAGYVKEVLVDIGDSVRKDQPLVSLSIPEMRDELEQKQALLAQADAEVKQAEAAVLAANAAVDTARAGIAQAEAGIGRAEGDYQRWKAEHSRIKQLAADGSVSTELVDEKLNQLRAAEAARQEAAANIQSANAAWKEAQANVHKAAADQRAAEARLRVAQADLARMKTMLAYTEIRAPFDGVVTRRNVDTGHYVHPSDGGTNGALLVVTRNDKVRVFVEVPEMEAPLVDAGDHPDPAFVRVQALGWKEFQAKVTRTGWSLDEMNRSLRTEIDIPNSGGILRPGMYAKARIVLAVRTNALVLPAAALVRQGDETFCWCVESGRAVRTPVTVGLRVGDEVEILAGLDGAQSVVRDGTLPLTEGQSVEILSTEAQ